MYFSVQKWSEAWQVLHPDEELPPCPWRIVESVSGDVIQGVQEFDSKAGWFRVLCRCPKEFEGASGIGYAAKNSNDLVTQIRRIPFKVLPYTPDLDRRNHVYADTVTYIDGRPVGPWLPAHTPFHQDAID